MTAPDTERIVSALAYATRVHAGHTRKASDIPYLSHLLAVAALVMEDGGDDETVIAALLHDAVEDQDVTPDEIAQQFGADVASIVVACSDSEGDPKPPWRERKERYLAHLAATADRRVLAISAADKLHNARSIVLDHERLGDDVWSRFNAPPDEQLWYYRSVTAVLAERLPGSVLIAELKRVVAQLAQLVQLVEGEG